MWRLNVLLEICQGVVHVAVGLETGTLEIFNVFAGCEFQTNTCLLCVNCD